MISNRIFLDIGHGSNTRERGGGKYVIKPDGVVFEEHTFNSDVAIVLRKKLEKLGFEVDWYQEPHSKEIRLKNRLPVINNRDKKHKYLMCISLHANASDNPKASGWGIFHWHTNKTTKRFCEIWYKNAKKLLDLKPWGTGVWTCKPHHWTNFMVVRKTTCPTVLIEHFFFTNFKELDKCNTTEYIDKFAEVTVKTICEYAGVEYIKTSTNDIINENMTVDEAKKIMKEKVGLEDKTIEYLYNYRYGDELLIALAKKVR